MKKQLLTLVRMALLTAGLSLVSSVVHADELIFIENSFNTAEDQPQLMPDDQKGTASWNAETKTLLLKDAQISTNATLLTGWLEEEITIRVEGSNSIVCTGMSDIIAMRSSIRITGPGTLYLSTNGNAAIANTEGGNVTIADGVSVIAVGNAGGIYGSWQNSLTIDNAYVCAYTHPDSYNAAASIGYFTKINLRNCEIVSPDGAKIYSINDSESISTDGDMESIDKIIIAPKKEFAKITIAEDANGKIKTPEGIDLTNVLVGTPITFTAEANEDYLLTKLMAGEEDITATKTLMVKGNTTVTPTFTCTKTYKVVLNQPEHGTLTVRETDYNLDAVPYGTILHFECTPEEGYELESIIAGEEDITESKYITVVSDIEVTANYKLIPIPTYKVKIVVLGQGSVTADFEDLNAVPDGTTIHLTCTPATDKDKLVGLAANGEDILATKSFVIESRDVTVDAQFKREKKDEAIDAVEGGNALVVAQSKNSLSIMGVQRGTQIQLHSALGEVILQSIAKDSTHQIDLTNIPSGIYILLVGNTTFKLYL